MKLLWRIFFNSCRGKVKTTEIKSGKRKFYFLVIARDADIDIKDLNKFLDLMWENDKIAVKGILTNYVEGIKFL